MCCMNQWSISVQTSAVWRPMKLLPFSRPIPSVRQSMKSRSTAEMMRDRPTVTTGSL